MAGAIYFGLNKKKNDENEESIELWQVLAFMVLPIIGIFLYFGYGVNTATNWPTFIQYALDSVMIAVTLIVVACTRRSSYGSYSKSCIQYEASYETTDTSSYNACLRDNGCCVSNLLR